MSRPSQTTRGIASGEFLPEEGWDALGLPGTGLAPGIGLPIGLAPAFGLALAELDATFFLSEECKEGAGLRLLVLMLLLRPLLEGFEGFEAGDGVVVQFGDFSDGRALQLPDGDECLFACWSRSLDVTRSRLVKLVGLGGFVSSSSPMISASSRTLKSNRLRRPSRL
mmetsp:Transcript_63558/g.174491  ORF Transcript_63558/g.174491 Transcript_63558/m.174491 type:complete len:167 (+) Transcript_63558:31-531(+)